MEAVTAAKLTAAVVQNRDTILKFVGAIALAVAFPVILLSTGMLELVSAFTPDGTVVSTSEMDITSTSVYRAVKEATGPYYDDLWNEMGHKRAEIMAEHTETVTLVGENGQPYETEKCDVIVSRHMNYLADAYLIAYLVCAEGMDVNTARIDADTAYRFLDSIGEIVVIESNGEYQVTNTFLSMDEIRRMWFPDEAEGKKFVACCEAYSQFMEISQTQIDIQAGNWTNVDFSAISLMNVPLYLQYKGRWAATPYGDGPIKKTGCAPTCLAMVLSYLRQEQILPNDVAAWVGNRFYVNGIGTSWGIFGAMEGAWGVKCTNIGKNQTLLLEALKDGKPVIASMGPGTFTKGGHFIVLSGVTLDGKIMVKDPNDSASKNHANTGFDVSLILRESKNMWVCG